MSDDSHKQKIQAFSLKLLTGKMYTRADLEKKLLRRFPESEDLIEEVLSMLEDKRLLDDEEYVRVYLQYELDTNYRGKFGYFQKLMRKGISKNLFEMVWEEIDPDEKVLAKKLLENNKFRFEQEGDSLKKKMKIQRFLQGRGFDFSVIREV